MLDSWYNIPHKTIFGYTIREVKEQIYKLIRKSCIMKKQIEYITQEREIKKLIEETEKKAKKGRKDSQSNKISSAAATVKKK